MFKYEGIANLIEKHLAVMRGEKMALTALDVRKWKETDQFCQNSCYENVCRAMLAVQGYSCKIIGGKRGSSTFTVEYSARKQPKIR